MKECEIYSRVKDKGSATAGWFAELLSPTPWFKDVVPNVGRWSCLSLVQIVCCSNTANEFCQSSGPLLGIP